MEKASEKDALVVVHRRDGPDLTISISSSGDNQFSTRDILDAVVGAKNEPKKDGADGK